MLLVVGADQPIKTVRELIDYGRAHPGKANYASSATPFQLAAELQHALLPGALSSVAYALPFAAIYNTPSEMLRGRASPESAVVLLGVQVMWLVVGLLGLRVLWRKGVRQYSAVGA